MTCHDGEFPYMLGNDGRPWAGAFRGAFKKGRRAGIDQLPCDPPYKLRMTATGGATWSYQWRKAWKDGWQHGQRELSDAR